MLAAVNRAADGNYSRYLLVEQLDEAAMRRAKEIFNHYRHLGILENGSFQDKIWCAYNERSRVNIKFDFSWDTYRENAGKWLACDPRNFMNAMKAYIVFQFGSLELPMLQDLANTFRRLVELKQFQNCPVTSQLYHIVEFLQFLPGCSPSREHAVEFLTERLQEKRSVWKSSQRTLANFQSYFRFHDKLTAFWETASNEDKRNFFPIYLWWMLTTILPLRPTEFTLLPRDCISENNGQTWITVRRTKLKGANGRIAYRIDKDYERKTYPVTQNLASEITWYIKETDNMPPSPAGALFRKGICPKPGIGPDDKKLRYLYSYNDLNIALHLFYKKFLTPGDDISWIKLGDTRHIAMIGLIISGGSPVICKELAGHEDVNISSNYYANIAKFVECAVYEQYQKSKKGGAAVLIGKKEYPFAPVQAMTRLEDGWCDSPRLKNHEITDCISGVGANGRIGDCHSCRFFRSDAPGLQLEFLDRSQDRKEVDADSWFLMQMVEAVRRGIGCEEDIQRALLRLQHSCHNYSERLWSTFNMEENRKCQEQKS